MAYNLTALKKLLETYLKNGKSVCTAPPLLLQRVLLRSSIKQYIGALQTRWTCLFLHKHVSRYIWLFQLKAWSFSSLCALGCGLPYLSQHVQFFLILLFRSLNVCGENWLNLQLFRLFLFSFLEAHDRRRCFHFHLSCPSVAVPTAAGLFGFEALCFSFCRC